MSIEEWIRNREQHGQVTFSVAEVREAFPTHSPKGLKTELSRTVKRGRIIAVYRGFYVIIPVQYQLKHIVPPQFYLDALMQHIGKPYYVCLLSAATLYAAAHQRPMQYQVMTVIPRISMSRTVPRRALRSPRTSPTDSGGVVISSFMIGSRNSGAAASAASRKPMTAAER